MFLLYDLLILCTDYDNRISPDFQHRIIFHFLHKLLGCFKSAYFRILLADLRILVIQNNSIWV